MFLLLSIAGLWFGLGCEPEPDLTNTAGYSVVTDQNGRHSINVWSISDHFVRNGLRLTNIVDLSIAEESPTPLPPGLLKRVLRMRSLEALRLPSRGFSDEDIALLGDGTGRIQTLDLDETNITDTFLKLLAFHENLKTVSVVRCQGITSRGVLDFVKNSTATNLYISKGLLSKDDLDHVGKRRPGLLIEINDKGYGSVVNKP